jgi:hypothetical protein
MRILLELLRILFIFLILGSLGTVILINLYKMNGLRETYFWLGSTGILLMIFVLYRNKFQFFGWYEGKGREKLSKFATLSLSILSIFFILVPFLLS